MKSALVIDDEKSILELVTAMLESLGWTVSCAESGANALQLVQSLKPDLVLSDIIMPDMEGMELIRKLRKSQPGVPIIVMSGNPIGTKFLESARIFGAKATLAKPFSTGELEAAVRSVTAEE